VSYILNFEQVNTLPKARWTTAYFSFCTWFSLDGIIRKPRPIPWPSFKFLTVVQQEEGLSNSWHMIQFMKLYHDDRRRAILLPVYVQNFWQLLREKEQCGSSIFSIASCRILQSSQGNLLYAVVILPVHLLLVRRVVLLLSTSVKKLWPKLLIITTPH
jgi:hypothetical protein